MSDDTTRIRVGDRLTIYPRGASRIWVADFWQDGIHKRQSLRTRNKKVAIDRATKLAADLIDGIYQSPPPAVTVRQAIDDYMAFLQSEGRARRTLVKYRGVLDRFVGYLQKHQVARLGQVRAGHFDRFRAELRQTLHPTTVYCQSEIVKQLFKWAKSRKMIVENAVADVKLHKPPLQPKASPTLEQVNLFLAKAEQPLRQHLVVLALTGLRAGELQRLRPEDVDLEGNWIYVNSRPGAETKTRMSRKVPIHPRLRGVLAALPRRRRTWLFTAAPSKKYPAGDHHINIKRLNEQFTRLASRLGLPVGRDEGFVIHSLRHFFETFTVNSGIPQRVIDTWLGHRSDKSMAAVYYRLSDADSQSFMAKVPFGSSESNDSENKEEK